MIPFRARQGVIRSIDHLAASADPLSTVQDLMQNPGRFSLCELAGPSHQRRKGPSALTMQYRLFHRIGPSVKSEWTPVCNHQSPALPDRTENPELQLSAARSAALLSAAMRRVRSVSRCRDSQAFILASEVDRPTCNISINLHRCLRGHVLGVERPCCIESLDRRRAENRAAASGRNELKAT